MKAKKILSILCTMAVVASMGMAALASGNQITEHLGTNSAEVQLSATLATENPSYLVNVTWTSMVFEYSESEKTWSTTAHTWSGGEGTWSNDGKATITAVNHSNRDVKVTASYTPSQDGQYALDAPTNGLTFRLAQFENQKLNAGDEENVNGEAGDNKSTATLSIEGTPTDNITKVTVGTVTVQLDTNPDGDV